MVNERALADPRWTLDEHCDGAAGLHRRESAAERVERRLPSDERPIALRLRARCRFRGWYGRKAPERRPSGPATLAIARNEVGANRVEVGRHAVNQGRGRRRI